MILGINIAFLLLHCVFNFLLNSSWGFVYHDHFDFVFSSGLSFPVSGTFRFSIFNHLGISHLLISKFPIVFHNSL